MYIIKGMIRYEKLGFIFIVNLNYERLIEFIKQSYHDECFSRNFELNGHNERINIRTKYS